MGTEEFCLLFFVLAIVIIALDQVSKFWIVHHMELYQSTVIIHDFFFITSHRNNGAAWGILQNQRTLLIIIGVIVVVAVIYFMTKMQTETLLTRLGLAFVLGGAISNLLDRIRTGEVVDFFHFQFGSYQFPIFNIADSALCIGVFLFLLATLFERTSTEDA